MFTRQRRGAASLIYLGPLSDACEAVEIYHPRSASAQKEEKFNFTPVLPSLRANGGEPWDELAPASRTVKYCESDEIRRRNCSVLICQPPRLTGLTDGGNISSKL